MIRRLLLASPLALLPAAAFADGPTLSTEEPQIDSSVRASPNEVRLEFHDAIDPAKSALGVFDATGHSVMLDKSRVSPSEKEMLSAGIKQLPAGTYTVRWHATDASSHKRSHGDYHFTISP